MINRLESATNSLLASFTSLSLIPKLQYNLHWDGLSITTESGHGYGLRLSNIPNNLSRQTKWMAGFASTILTATIANAMSTEFSIDDYNSSSELGFYQLDISDAYAEQFSSTLTQIKNNYCGMYWYPAGPRYPQSIKQWNIMGTNETMINLMVRDKYDQHAPAIEACLINLIQTAYDALYHITHTSDPSEADTTNNAALTRTNDPSDDASTSNPISSLSIALAILISTSASVCIAIVAPTLLNKICRRYEDISHHHPEAGSLLISNTENHSVAIDIAVDIVDRFICPITHEIMNDPVVATDGRHYERKAIELWLDKHHTSPIDRKEMKKSLCSDLDLKREINTFREQCEKDFKVQSELKKLKKTEKFRLFSYYRYSKLSKTITL